MTAPGVGSMPGAARVLVPDFGEKRGTASGRATRELIMLTAERLFAERGIEAVPLREIGQACGQRNKYAVQYHFGERSVLVGEIYAFRSGQLNERRYELLDELEQADQLSDVHALIRVLIQPHAESMLDPENHFVGFLARALLDIGTMSLQEAGQASPNMGAHHELRERVRVLVPDVPRSVFNRRFPMLFNFAVNTFAECKRRDEGLGETEVADLLDEIVSIIVAGLREPVLQGPRQPTGHGGPGVEQQLRA